jgi:GGDEF domain-containing protein
MQKMARFSWKRAKTEEANLRVPVVVPLLEKLRPLYESELRRARRYQRPLSLMILDIAVAEALHGAAARTHRIAQCIRLGELLQEVLRETDLPGYEPATQEFVALLPEADSAAAEEVGERIRRLWSAQPGAVNLTIGMATYPEDGLLLDNLMDAARRALTSSLTRNPAGSAQGVTHA